MVFLPGREPRHHLDLEILQCLFLRFGKAPDIVMREPDVLFDPFGNKSGCGGDFIFRQYDAAIIFVELCGIGQRSFIAAGFDVAQDALNDFMDIRCITGRRQGRLFQILSRHHTILLISSGKKRC